MAPGFSPAVNGSIAGSWKNYSQLPPAPHAHPPLTPTHFDGAFFTFCAEWDKDLVSSLTAVADAKSGEDARKEIPALLSKLDDPFTRWLPPK